MDKSEVKEIFIESIKECAPIIADEISKHTDSKYYTKPQILTALLSSLATVSLCVIVFVWSNPQIIENIMRKEVTSEQISIETIFDGISNWRVNRSKPRIRS